MAKNDKKDYRPFVLARIEANPQGLTQQNIVRDLTSGPRLSKLTALRLLVESGHVIEKIIGDGVGEHNRRYYPAPATVKSEASFSFRYNLAGVREAMQRLKSIEKLLQAEKEKAEKRAAAPWWSRFDVSDEEVSF